MTKPKDTVQLDKPSPYHGPRPHTVRDHASWLRLRFAYRVYRRILRRYSPTGGPGRILDLGAGPGYLSRLLEQWRPRATVVSLDLDPRLLGEASARRSQRRLVCSSAQQLPFRSGSFECVIALHVIEHLYQPDAMIAEVERTLDSEGLFILATPNPGGLAARALGKGWQGWRDDHVSLKRPTEWAALLKGYGFVPLLQHTTLLSGFALFRFLPFSLLNWAALAIFGSFPWSLGEAYIGAWRKRLVVPPSPGLEARSPGHPASGSKRI